MHESRTNHYPSAKTAKTSQLCCETWRDMQHYEKYWRWVKYEQIDKHWLSSFFGVYSLQFCSLCRFDSMSICHLPDICLISKLKSFSIVRLIIMQTFFRLFRSFVVITKASWTKNLHFSYGSYSIWKIVIKFQRKKKEMF